MKYNGKDLIVLREQSLKLIISFTRIVSHKVIFYFFLQGSRKYFWSTYWMHFSQIKVWRLSFFVIIIRGHGAETVKSGRLYLFSDDTSYNWQQNWKIEWEWRQCDRITFCEIWVSFYVTKKLVCQNIFCGRAVESSSSTVKKYCLLLYDLFSFNKAQSIRTTYIYAKSIMYLSYK